MFYFGEFIQSGPTCYMLVPIGAACGDRWQLPRSDHLEYALLGGEGSLKPAILRVFLGWVAYYSGKTFISVTMFSSLR